MEFVPFGAADKIKLSVAIVQNIIAVPTKSGKTCSERDAMKFMMLCQAQRLNPFAGDSFLVGYDGQNGPTFSLITAHQAFLKRAESSPDYDGMTSGILVNNDGTIEEREGDFHLPDEDVVGGWAKVFNKKRSHPTYRKIRMARFNKGFAQWKEDPAGMIVKCAEADALRSTFPTLLGGLYLREEKEAGAVIDATVEAASPQFEKQQIKKKSTAGKGELFPEPGKGNILTQLEGLMKDAEISELEMLEFMRKQGYADTSLSSLKDIFDMSPDAIQKVLNDWDDVSKELADNVA